MRCFEILIVAADISENGGPFVPDDRLTFWLPDEAKELLEPILSSYGRDPEWYFDQISFDRWHPPWALACLDREYAIAGHIASARPMHSGISFTPYKKVPTPIPSDFVPGVGLLSFQNKSGLQSAANNSPIFQLAWEALINCSVDRRWLVLMDFLPDEWVAKVIPGDRELWLSLRNG
jgi:hypothetical protein